MQVVLMPLQATAAPVLSGVDNDPSVNAGCDSGLFAVGFRFTANGAATVTRLGAYDDQCDGLGNATTVGLWTIGRTLLASVDLAAGASGDLIDGFRYADIGPVDLVAGAQYVLAAHALPVSLCHGRTRRHRRSGDHAPAITLGVGAYRHGPLSFPDEVDSFFTINRPFLSANMIIGAGQVAEPAFVALLLAGVAGVVLARRREHARGA